jgi:phosphoribosyl-ATP pyrophosphohydrolase
MDPLFEELSSILEERKQADPRSSYVASLYGKGTEAILKKVIEEATEVVLAGQGGDGAALVHETADLWFHTLVLLAHRGLGPEQVMAELARRFGRSGLEEKAGRAK